MEEEKIEEDLKSLLNAIALNQRNKSQELVKDALEKLTSSGFNYSKPEDFNCLIIHKLNNGVEEIARTLHDIPLNGIEDTHKPNFIYIHYDFLEHNIRELCVLREGNVCCVDKSRFILKMYLDYSLTGKIPEFSLNVENYWTPNFGTYDEWICLCDGLYKLYYGKTEQYLKSYNTLIQSEIRKFKHILHTWYIRFKDGEIVKFNNTWDDKQKNPLDNEYFDKDEYYVIYGKYVKNRNYEIYEDADFLKNHYCKVPKADIDKIYKVSEEKMI